MSDMTHVMFLLSNAVFIGGGSTIVREKFNSVFIIIINYYYWPNLLNLIVLLMLWKKHKPLAQVCLVGHCLLENIRNPMTREDVYVFNLIIR
jgi:hypothetical protein